jgi:hypothetical protein
VDDQQPQPQSLLPQELPHPQLPPQLPQPKKRMMRMRIIQMQLLLLLQNIYIAFLRA